MIATAVASSGAGGELGMVAAKMVATPNAQTRPCLRELLAASWAVIKKFYPGVTAATTQSRAREIKGPAYRRCWFSIRDCPVGAKRE